MTKSWLVTTFAHVCSRTRRKFSDSNADFQLFFLSVTHLKFSSWFTTLKNDISIIWIKDDNSGKIMKSIPRKINNFHSDFRYGEKQKKRLFLTRQDFLDVDRSTKTNLIMLTLKTVMKKTRNETQLFVRWNLIFFENTTLKV